MAIRNVRPSFLKVEVDGRKSSIETGPEARSGCIAATFYVRENGEAREALSVGMMASADGSTVTVRVRDLRTGRTVHEYTVRQ